MIKTLTALFSGQLLQVFSSLTVLFLCGFLSEVLHASDDSPAFKNLRYQEDWSTWQPDNSEIPRTNFLDNVKHIQSKDSPDVWLSIGGQARVRFEQINNFGFSDANDDGFLLTRLRLHGDLHLSRYFRVFVEGKSALQPVDRDLPGGRRTADVDELDLQNAFVEIILPVANQSFRVNAGRREILFGKQRLVSPANWANTRQTFDGVHGIFESRDWKVDSFWTRPVNVDKFDFNQSDDTREFYGFYSNGKLPGTAVNVDLYWLALERDSATFNGTTGEEDRYTVGGRLFGSLVSQNLIYDIEGAYQYGDIGSADVSAWFLTTELYYTGELFQQKIKAGVGLDIASGDDSFGGDVQTFDPLFPTGHAHLGFIDTVGRFNIIDFRPGVVWSLNEKISVRTDLHNFWRQNNNDAFYRPGGVVVFGAAAGESSYIGSEIDILASYTFNSHVEGKVGYSHFFTGDFINEADPAAKDIDFIYALVQYTF